MAELHDSEERTGQVLGSGPEPTRVRVGIKFLKNLGNFENVTLDFEIETSVMDNETTDMALDRVYNKCGEHVGKRLREILADHR